MKFRQLSSRMGGAKSIASAHLHSHNWRILLVFFTLQTPALRSLVKYPPYPSFMVPFYLVATLCLTWLIVCPPKWMVNVFRLLHTPWTAVLVTGIFAAVA